MLPQVSARPTDVLAWDHAGGAGAVVGVASLGVSHHTVSLATLERLAIPPDKISHILRQLADAPTID